MFFATIEHKLSSVRKNINSQRDVPLLIELKIDIFKLQCIKNT
jgi:hypothetical protein